MYTLKHYYLEKIKRLNNKHQTRLTQPNTKPANVTKIEIKYINKLPVLNAYDQCTKISTTQLTFGIKNNLYDSRLFLNTFFYF